MNKVELIGRLTRDPEIREPDDADAVLSAKFTLAVDRRYRTKHGPKADFIKCITFQKQAELVRNYLRQGMRIAAVARIAAGVFHNHEGDSGYFMQVVVEEIEFLEPKPSEEKKQAPSPADQDISDDELAGMPFR